MNPVFSFFFMLCLLVTLSACTSQHHSGQAAPLVHSQWRVENRLLTENSSNKIAYHLDVRYPEIIGRPDTASTRRLNQLIFAYVKNNLDAFKEKLPQDSSDYADYPSQLFYNDFSLRYTATLLQPRGHTLVSLRFEITTRYTGEFTALRHFAVLNYDLSEGKILTLASLFKPESPYVETLAHQCSQQLRKRFTQGMPWMPWDSQGSRPLPQNFQLWNLDREGLKLTFQEYQVTPYSAKPQSIFISYATLRPLLSPASPVAAYANA